MRIDGDRIEFKSTLENYKDEEIGDCGCTIRILSDKEEKELLKSNVKYVKIVCGERSFERVLRKVKKWGEHWLFYWCEMPYRLKCPDCGGQMILAKYEQCTGQWRCTCGGHFEKVMR